MLTAGGLTDRVVTTQFDCARFNVGSNMLIICVVSECYIVWRITYLFILYLKCYLIYITITTQYFLSCIEVDHAITYMNELLMFAYNLLIRCMRQDASWQ